MKIGDQLYCKLSYKNFILKNSTYEILSIFNISSSSSEKDLYYNMRSEIYIDPYGQTEDSIVFDQNDIESLFYTQQEIRKIKLEKLNEYR